MATKQPVPIGRLPDLINGIYVPANDTMAEWAHPGGELGVKLTRHGAGFEASLWDVRFGRDKIYGFYRTQHASELLALTVALDNSYIVRNGGLEKLLTERQLPQLGFIREDDLRLVFNPFFDRDHQAIRLARRDMGMEAADPEVSYGAEYVHWLSYLEEVTRKARAKAGPTVTQARTKVA